MMMTAHECGGDEMIQNRNVNDDWGLTLVLNPGGLAGPGWVRSQADEFKRASLMRCKPRISTRSK